MYLPLYFPYERGTSQPTFRFARQQNENATYVVTSVFPTFWRPFDGKARQRVVVSDVGGARDTQGARPEYLLSVVMGRHTLSRAGPSQLVVACGPFFCACLSFEHRLACVNLFPQ